ncbi:hypothetical protein BD309DRAFT_368687 [Dichomitus squalens]|nr:hypothetical protein BD309DRAFT_368687 [Dichomitus squalens]
MCLPMKPKTDTPMLPVGIPSAPPRATQSSPPLAMPLVHLTPGVCARLKDFTDADVLSTCPVLRVLVLRSADSAQGGTAAKSHEAFVTDGQGYAWLALTSSATARIGDRNDRRSVQVGSAVRLKKMRTLPTGDLGIRHHIYRSPSLPILVDSFEVADNFGDGRLAALSPGNSAIRPEEFLSPGFALHMTPSPQPVSDPPPGGISIHERAARLLADAKFREERRRRLALERALADVCSDLHRLESLVPATMEALREIDELTSAVMSID